MKLFKFFYNLKDSIKELICKDLEFEIIPKQKYNNNIVHFISYGNYKFNNSKRRIFNEAIDSKWFYTIDIFCKKSLSKEFKNEFKNILKLKRGGGYWIWKFNIIINKLKNIQEDEFLVYLDSGCSINKKGNERFLEYINMINESKHNIISFQMDNDNEMEKKFITKEILKEFDISIDSDILKTGQYVGGILIMKKSNEVIKLFEDCLDKIRIDQLMITDHYNKNQCEEFIENRHDQSFTSILRKIRGSIIIKDETYFTDFKSDIALQYPFLGTRIRE